VPFGFVAPKRRRRPPAPPPPTSQRGGDPADWAKAATSASRPEAPAPHGESMERLREDEETGPLSPLSPPPLAQGVPSKAPAALASDEEGERMGYGAALGASGWARFGLDENAAAVAVHSAGDAASSLAVLVLGVVALALEPHPPDTPGATPGAAEKGAGGDDGRPSAIERGFPWAGLLDPLLTIVLSLAMALAMRGTLRRCFHVLLEGSALSPPGHARLAAAIEAALERAFDDAQPRDGQRGKSPRGGPIPGGPGLNLGPRDRGRASPSSARALGRLGLASLVITDLDLDGKSRRATVILAPSLRAAPAAGAAAGSGSGSPGPTHRALRSVVVAELEAAGVKWASVEVLDDDDDRN